MLQPCLQNFLHEYQICVLAYFQEEGIICCGKQCMIPFTVHVLESDCFWIVFLFFRAFSGISFSMPDLNFYIQFHIERIPFQAGHEVETLEEAKAAIQKLINKGSRLNLTYRG